jgi:signal transduction histidine kinase
MGIFTGIVRDLTDVKRTQEKLIQSERLAAIGQTMTGLAHESRNALQRTRACLDMLEIDLDGQPDLLDLVKRGQTALDELHRLYEEVRDYAAPSPPELALCDLSRVWETAWTNLAGPRMGKNIRFDAQTNDVNLTCRIDPHRIGQVLRNLFENAVAAIAGDGEITLKCADAHIDGRDAVRISIRDNGPGFHPDRLEAVFDPFFTTKTKGTGLGMAIAKRIVEEHGGVIKANNAPNGGAEAELILPRNTSPSGLTVI